MTDARYQNISLEPDIAGRDGVFQLKFSTMPGMNVVISELRDGDLAALAEVLAAHRKEAGSL
jgi:hypothetical protein